MTVFFNPLNGLIPFRQDYPNSLLIILCQGPPGIRLSVRKCGNGKMLERFRFPANVKPLDANQGAQGLARAAQWE